MCKNFLWSVTWAHFKPQHCKSLSKFEFNKKTVSGTGARSAAAAYNNWKLGSPHENEWNFLQNHDTLLKKKSATWLSGETECKNEQKLACNTPSKPGIGEWVIKFNSLSRTADIKVHVSKQRQFTYFCKFLQELQQMSYNCQFRPGMKY